MSFTDFNTIKTEDYKGYLKIILSRPDKRNALNNELIQELKFILSNTPDKSYKGLILTGAGSAFCAGADLVYLKELQNKTYEENYQDSQNLKEVFYNIYTYPKPVIAVVNGAAIAGGCGLASICDFVIADNEAKFGYPEVKIGFVASLVSVFLIRIVGERIAREILLTGAIFSAEKAKEIGLINYIYNKNQIWSETDKLIENLNNNSLTAMKLSKELFYKIDNLRLNKLLENACRFNAQSRQSKDFLEGISAFIDKRKPVWQNNK